MPAPHRPDDPALLKALSDARARAKLTEVFNFFETAITRIREAGPERQVTAELFWELMARDFKALSAPCQSYVWAMIGKAVRVESLVVYGKMGAALVVYGDHVEETMNFFKE